jgi:hypothetical protein
MSSRVGLFETRELVQRVALRVEADGLIPTAKRLAVIAHGAVGTCELDDTTPAEDAKLRRAAKHLDAAAKILSEMGGRWGPVATG